MKVFGITMVRDEAELLRVSIAHHLRAGVDHVLVVDNGSSDHVADWVLPFDADEFWVTAPGRLRDVLSGSTAGALRVQLRNFIQSRAERDSVDPTSLLTMTRRVAEPAHPIEQCH